MHKSIRSKATLPVHAVRRKSNVSAAETTSTVSTARMANHSGIGVDTSYHPPAGFHGGELNDLASIEAELDVLKEEVIRLRSQRNEHLVVTSYELSQTQDSVTESSADSESEDIVLESAAVRLQRIHERSNRTSSRTTSFDAVDEPTFELENFPVLSSTSTLTRRNATRARGSPASYARFVGYDLSKHQATLTSPTRIARGNTAIRQSAQKVDHDWTLLQHSPSSSRERPFSTIDSLCSTSTTTDAGSITTTRHHNHDQGIHDDAVQPSATTRHVKLLDGPSLATEKRATDQKRRRGLPEAWIQSSDSSPTKSAISAPHYFTENQGTFGCKKATTMKRSVHKTHTTPSTGRETVPKARQETQVPRTPIHKKSQSNFGVTTRVSPSKKANYASPTAASKHRTTMSAESEKPARAQKDGKFVPLRIDITRKKNASDDSGSNIVDISPWSVRTTTSSGAVFGPVDPYLTLGQHTSNGSSSPVRRVETNSDIDKRTTAYTILQPTPSNVTLVGHKKIKTNLKIAIPDSFSDFGSAQNPTRIPRPAQINRDTSSSSAQTSSGGAAFGARRMTVDQTPQQETMLPRGEDALQKSQERANLLEPIKRRLSSLASQLSLEAGSRISSAETTIVEQSLGNTEKLDIQALKSYQAPEVAASPDLYNVKTCPGHKRAPAISEPCSPKSQPASPTKFASASTWLLNTIKRTSVERNDPGDDIVIQMASVFSKPANVGVKAESQRDHHQKVNDHDRAIRPPLEEQHQLTQAQLSTIMEASDICHSRKPSTILVPQDDPAVLACGPMQSSNLQTPSVDPHLSHEESRVSSLRATAPAFVPVTTKSVRVQPTTTTSNISRPQSQHQTSGSDVGFTSWLQPSDWHTLSNEERAHIKEQRRARGSSISSTVMSTFSRSDTTGSPEKIGRPHWDWFTSARDGAPTKFGRAPLPSMAEDETIEKSRGWGIGSAAPGWWYGWRGGDGLEISFVGHGPDAEKNSYAPVNFHMYNNESDGQGALLPVQTYGHTRGENNDGYARTPTAPRRMREWATKMGYPRVPCGNFEIVDAVEHVGNYNTRDCVDGWCYGCVPAH